MINRRVARALALAAISLAFGITALRYPLGTLSHAGPGLFPLILSGALLLIAILMIVQARFIESQKLEIHVKNIGLIMLGMISFALISMFFNMTLGIVAMVFVVSAAGSSFSWLRCLKISAGLVAVAFVFQKGLGLNLPLY